ncbi:glycoside hydrolase family 25 protein [Oscillatoria sp. FACHB-1406]|uniref:glycoside hydrolase family 25 protein n=1 Tax=Oscillatoria sp. FACHB-1406 TaxID=2692846 RepID=UPI0016886358|nr:glycoside hydrolase family 25 protein [Oscillatoria sp. FACHB-1406]MBD2579786.1 glycoside hydrolase family 25 protein [Oscillatoria sp. FACHB-1406]
MSVKITNPANLTQLTLGDTINFQGTAENSIAIIELFAEQYLLGKVPVVDGKWAIHYPFIRGGKRRIVAKGFDAAGRQLTADALDIFLIEKDADARLLGIDVSNYNPPIDWHRVKAAGVDFAFAKATEGGTWKDDTFSTNWAGMKSAGILRGAYHFFRPQKAAEEQVKNFLSVVQDVLEPGDLPPVLDLEPWPENVGRAWKELDFEQRIARVKNWLKQVEAATKEKPIIYTGPSFWSEYMKDTQEFADYPLWIAHYTPRSRPSVPGDNWGGKGYTIWQYTEVGSIAGVKGNVDKNRFKGSLGDLLALAQNISVA